MTMGPRQSLLGALLAIGLVAGPVLPSAAADLPAGVGLTDPTLAFGLSSVSAWSAGLPLLDLMKTARPFIATPRKGGAKLSAEEVAAGGWLDDRGWPVAIPPDAAGLRTIWDWSSSKNNPVLAASREGTYLLTYAGEGTLKLTGDVKVVDSAPGRILFENRAGGTMTLDILATDPGGTGDHVRDIVVVKARYAPLLAMGEIFNPDWLTVVQDARQLRFMDWMDTNDSKVADWAERPKVADASWTGPGGVPLEVMVQLANQTGTEPWFNMPVGASDDYIRQFATQVRDTLNPALQVHVEFANETWNSALPAYHALSRMSEADWGVSAPMDYFAKRATETARIWDEVFGAEAAARVDNVLATQTQNPAVAERALVAPQWQDHEPEAYVVPASAFDSLAVTTYFGGSNMKNDMLRTELLAVIADRSQDADAWFKARLMDPEVRGSIPQIVTAWAAHKAIAEAHGLKLVAYEGGQHLLHAFKVKGIAPGEMDTMVDYMAGFIRSQDMADLYRSLWDAWVKVSDGPFMQYGDVSTPSKFGAWGIYAALGDTNPRAELLTRLNATTPNWFGTGGPQYLQGVIRVAGDEGETIEGTDRDDFLIGGAGDDTIRPGLGRDAIDGGAGHDTLVLPGRAADHALTVEGRDHLLTGKGFSHRLRGIEAVVFDDGQSLALDAPPGD